MMTPTKGRRKGEDGEDNKQERAVDLVRTSICLMREFNVHLRPKMFPRAAEGLEQEPERCVLCMRRRWASLMFNE